MTVRLPASPAERLEVAADALDSAGHYALGHDVRLASRIDVRAAKLLADNNDSGIGYAMGDHAWPHGCPFGREILDAVIAACAARGIVLDPGHKVIHQEGRLPLGLVFDQHIEHRTEGPDRALPGFEEIAILFGGDRRSYIDRCLIVEGARGNRSAIRGLASIAGQGEAGEGEPTLVGLWVDPRDRRQGIARDIVCEAARLCPVWGFERLSVDVTSAAARALFAALPPDVAARFRVIDCVIDLEALRAAGLLTA